ncbi:MAG: 3',5'-cyclic-nucleotide phosphodiesterase [Phylliscum demangeonii]|nr:MAG: 3',5'-cyclic-nucleotide phosphodiesterase [Phylliscum demangeonii]
MDPDRLLVVKRARKRSWVGVDEQKPHAYLREAMVSGLMDRICNPDHVGDESVDLRPIHIPPDRMAAVTDAVGTWAFSAHEYSEDELVQAAAVIFRHALTLPDLEPWRIAPEDLQRFVRVTRTAYNTFVPYHNFRHVVDVLQAVFYFLLQLGALPPYPAHPHAPPPPHPATSGARPRPVSPVASLLRPFEALTLLITAIGHDVGHPGVNNAFLVNLKAPLAQLYNDRSVLESFHCAAFSQILRRYWPAAFHAPEMRRLLIHAILATDMGLHFDYMAKLGRLQEKLHASPAAIDGWDARAREEYRVVTCSLLIKCADISNVARTYDVAARWATILTDEFARQASMEVDLGIPTALFAPPVRDSVVELGKSQLGFMNLFARPLFLGVADVLPAMRFAVDHIDANKATWERTLAIERDRVRFLHSPAPAPAPATTNGVVAGVPALAHRPSRTLRSSDAGPAGASSTAPARPRTMPSGSSSSSAAPPPLPPAATTTTAAVPQPPQQPRPRRSAKRLFIPRDFHFSELGLWTPARFVNTRARTSTAPSAAAAAAATTVAVPVPVLVPDPVRPPASTSTSASASISTTTTTSASASAAPSATQSTAPSPAAAAAATPHAVSHGECRSEDGGQRTAKVRIYYCTRCKWMLRAAYYAQELLSTFDAVLAEVALVPEPEKAGMFLVEVEVEMAVEMEVEVVVDDDDDDDDDDQSSSTPVAVAADPSAITTTRKEPDEPGEGEEEDDDVLVVAVEDRGGRRANGNGHGHGHGHGKANGNAKGNGSGTGRGGGSIIRRVVWDRQAGADNGFPEVKELKRRVRDLIEPNRALGHIDRVGR